TSNDARYFSFRTRALPQAYGFFLQLQYINVARKGFDGSPFIAGINLSPSTLLPYSSGGRSTGLLSEACGREKHRLLENRSSLLDANKWARSLSRDEYPGLL
ncbi:hypothetical protein SK128_022485, partial [Halocaridina rubra]